MKKGFLLVIFLIFILPLVYSADRGVSICNIDRMCGPCSAGALGCNPSTGEDNFCPEDYFEDGVSCYIKDPDCCSIERAVWSSSADLNTIVSGIREGESIYMNGETKHCLGKNAYFDVYRLEERLFLPDREYFVTTFGPKLVSTDKINVRWTSFTDPADEGISKFKFKIRINPTLESGVIEVESIDGVNSCNDLIDNDADGCGDEAIDCADGKEDFQDISECGANSNCGNWKCTVGECIDGFKTVNCPALPNGCNLAVPPPNVRCYEKSTPFPFFTGFNFGAVILLLTGFYGLRIYRRK